MPFSAAEAPKVLFFAYRAHDLLLAREPLETDLRNFVEGRHPSCTSGSVEVAFDDRDRSGSLSSGDSAEVLFDACTYSSAFAAGTRFLDGRLSFNEVMVSNGVDRWHVATVEPVLYSDGIAGTMQPVPLSLDYVAEVRRAQAPQEMLRSSILAPNLQIAKSLSGEQVSFLTSHQGAAASELILGADNDSFESSFSLSLLTRIESISPFPGSFRAETTTALRGRRSENGSYPSSGGLRVEGTGINNAGLLQSLVAILTAQGTNGNVRIDVDFGGDGSIELSRETTWTELAALE